MPIPVAVYLRGDCHVACRAILRGGLPVRRRRVSRRWLPSSRGRFLLRLVHAEKEDSSSHDKQANDRTTRDPRLYTG